MTMVWAPKMHTEFWLRNLSANGHLGDLEGNRNIIKIKKYVSEDKRQMKLSKNASSVKLCYQQCCTLNQLLIIQSTYTRVNTSVCIQTLSCICYSQQNTRFCTLHLNPSSDKRQRGTEIGLIQLIQMAIHNKHPSNKKNLSS